MGEKMMIDDIENQLVYIADRMIAEKCSEIQHTIELITGDKFKIHIRRINKKW